MQSNPLPPMPLVLLVLARCKQATRKEATIIFVCECTCVCAREFSPVAGVAPAGSVPGRLCHPRLPSLSLNSLPPQTRRINTATDRPPPHSTPARIPHTTLVQFYSRYLPPDHPLYIHALFGLHSLSVGIAIRRGCVFTV